MLLPVVLLGELGCVRGKPRCDFRMAIKTQNPISELGLVSRFEISNHFIIEIRFDCVEARDNRGYSESHIFEQLGWKHAVSKRIGGIGDDSN